MLRACHLHGQKSQAGICPSRFPARTEDWSGFPACCHWGEAAWLCGRRAVFLDPFHRMTTLGGWPCSSPLVSGKTLRFREKTTPDSLKRFSPGACPSLGCTGDAQNNPKSTLGCSCSPDLLVCGDGPGAAPAVLSESERCGHLQPQMSPSSSSPSQDSEPVPSELIPGAICGESKG